MDFTAVYATRCILSWLITALSMAGYVMTRKRLHEKWPLWAVLGTGWAFLAISNTVVLTGGTLPAPALLALWLSSYVLVFASLTLLFVKFVEMMKKRTTP